MQIVPTVEDSKLSTAYLQPKWVRIAFSRTDMIFRQCHFFIANSDGKVDMFRQEQGLCLERSASFNNVMLIEYVSEPPEPETSLSPVEVPEVEVAENPTDVPVTSTEDSDIPF